MLIDSSGRTVEISYDSNTQASICGNIYAAKIENVVPSVNAAFAEYEKGTKGFLRLDKVRQDNVIFLNPLREKGPLRQGDMILVKAVKDPHGSKGASLSADIAYDGDIDVLRKTYSRCRKAGLVRKVPDHYITKAFEAGLSEVVTDSSRCYMELLSYYNEYFSGTDLRIRMYKDRSAGFRSVYSIEKRLREALDTKVYMKSGAFLVIEHTEAFVSVDVNTGRSVSKLNSQDEYLRVNIEAAHEAARQIRLRNLSGIILVDFINLKSDDYKAALMQEFKMYLAEDPLKPVLVDMTGLGLAEVTRKKIRRPLYECI